MLPIIGKVQVSKEDKGSVKTLIMIALDYASILTTADGQ